MAFDINSSNALLSPSNEVNICAAVPIEMLSISEAGGAEGAVDLLMLPRGGIAGRALGGRLFITPLIRDLKL